MDFLSLLIHLFSVMLSIIISIAISFLDNFTLFEIARSFYFALYFSFFFFIIGVFILSKSYRNYITKFQHTDFIQLEQRDTLRFKYIFILYKKIVRLKMQKNPCWINITFLYIFRLSKSWIWKDHQHKRIFIVSH